METQVFQNANLAVAQHINDCAGRRSRTVFTERDVLFRIVDEGRNPNATLVADVMTAKPVVVTSTTTVSEAMAIVSEKRCRHLPVVEENRLVGLVSSGDLTHWVTRNQEFHIQDLVNFITDKYPG